MSPVVTVERALVVVRIGPMATIQDDGRPGFARYGVPASGALDFETMHAAMAAVHADSAIELPLLPATFRAIGRVRVAIDYEPAFDVQDGEMLDVPRVERAVRYLAIEGGIDVPLVLGSRSTFLAAALGGREGSALARGDVVRIGDRRSSTHAGSRPNAAPVVHPVETIEVLATRDANPRLLEGLLAGSFRVDSRSDRVGTRLQGVPIADVPEALALSRPMIPGAVQIPSDGQPIVLGPDGPTTGGYPVAAVVTRESRARLARLRPGSPLRFHLVQSPT